MTGVCCHRRARKPALHYQLTQQSENARAAARRKLELQYAMTLISSFDSCRKLRISIRWVFPPQPAILVVASVPTGFSTCRLNLDERYQNRYTLKMVVTKAQQMMGTCLVDFNHHIDQRARHSYTRCRRSMSTLARPHESSICFFALIVQSIRLFGGKERTSHLQVKSTHR